VEKMISIRRSEYEQLLSAVSVIAELREKVRQLQEETELLKNGRNSTPPYDISCSNVHRLRRSNGKKTGGQKGHPGHHLPVSDTPDTVIAHIPKMFMRKIGSGIQGYTGTNNQKRSGGF
jgi:transposase